MLAALVEYTKLSPTAFARSISVGQPAISLILTGARESLSLEMAKKITDRYTEISAEWLLFGRGEMLKEKRSEKKHEGSEVVEAGVREPAGTYEKGLSVMDWMNRYVALQEKYIALREEYEALKERCRKEGKR